MQDIVKRYVNKQISGRSELLVSKLLTVFWGAVCLFFAFFVGGISDTLIESINKIGSLINGPLLAVFLMGMLSRRVNGRGATGGLIAGFAVNLLLWKTAPNVSWLWWNVIGFVVAYSAGVLISLTSSAPDPARLEGTVYLRAGLTQRQTTTNWRPYYATLAVYGAGMLLLLVAITYG